MKTLGVAIKMEAFDYKISTYIIPYIHFATQTLCYSCSFCVRWFSMTDSDECITYGVVQISFQFDKCFPVCEIVTRGESHN